MKPGSISTGFHFILDGVDVMDKVCHLVKAGISLQFKNISGHM